MLDSITTFFKPERDPFFKLGKEQGIEQTEVKKSREFVTNLILKLGWSDEQVADIANVTVEFVRDVRSSLKK